MIMLRTILSPFPEKQKEVLQTLLSIIEPPAHCNGLLSDGIYHDIEDSTVFKLISEWESRRHLIAHLRSDRFGVLLGTKSLLCKPIDIQILTFTKLEGMEVVTAARETQKSMTTTL
jgi:quinol monooxygenase YgiN